VNLPKVILAGTGTEVSMEGEGEVSMEGEGK